MNAIRTFGFRKSWLGLGAIGLLLGALLATGQPARAGMMIVLDECQLVDHFYNEGDYPQVDFSQSTFQGALSLGGVGVTFDLKYVPQGSDWDVAFSDGTRVSGTVGDFGKTFAYRGFTSYGSYPYTSELTDPDGNPIEGAPSGALILGANEKECNEDTLIDSPPAPTSTPTDTPVLPTSTNTPPPSPTHTPTATLTPQAVEGQGPDVATGDGFDLPLFGPTPDWIVYLCCLILLVLAAGGTVVIVVRRRRRRMETLSNGPSKIDRDLLR